MDKRTPLTFLFTLFFSLQLFSQCFPDLPVFPTCDEVDYCCCMIELDGSCNTLPSAPPFGPYGPTPLCPNGTGIPDNMHWMQFVAGYTDITLIITPDNCQPAAQMGIQAGIFYDCTFSESVACVSDCQTSAFELVMTDLEIGHCYYLFVDGCAGNVCDYYIDILQTPNPIPPLGPIGPIDPDNLAICEGADAVSFSIPPVENAAYYYWTVPPGSTYTETNAAGTEISVTFGEVAGQVCAYAIKGCPFEEKFICTDLTLLPPPQGIEVASYCVDNEPCFLCPADGLCYTAGDYMITLLNGSYQGCDSIIHLTVTEKFPTESFVEAVICAGEFYEVCGIPFSDPGQFQIDCSPGYNGCDSIINLSCIVLEPYANVEPPEVLGCDPNGSIYLDGLNSYGDFFLWETSDGVICDINPTSLLLEVCASGTYCLTATSIYEYQDGSGTEWCDDQICVYVPYSDDLNVSISGTDENCMGDQTGTAEVVAIGGIPPYTYSWCDGTTTSDNIQNLPAGNCCVTVTDAASCTAIICHEVQSPTLLACYSETIDVQCNGDDSGMATMVGIGGVPPYSFEWCNGQTGSTVSGLPPGNCWAIVTDANGCTAFVLIIINEPPPVSIMTMATDLSCAGNFDGTAVAMGTGGVGNFTYEWSNGETTPDLNNLPAGTFTVTVTDANGCTEEAAVNISEPDPMIINTTNTNISCLSPNDGTATVFALGGLPPFSYEWCNGQTTATATNLNAGTCCVVVTDNNGCSAESCVTVINTQSDIQLSISGTNQQCAGDDNGTADVMVTGGIPPYTYAWCDGTNTSSVENLSVGQCCVTVTDATGCSSNICHSVNAPAILACISTVVDAQCNGDGTGGGTITGVGGTPPYSYLWCDGQTTETVSGLPPGECSVIVTDANNCSTTIAILVNEPPVISIISMVNNPSCSGATDGNVVVMGLGGVGDFDYEWSNNQTGSELNNLPAGDLTVTITDANGCTAVEQFTLDEVPEIEIAGTTEDAVCGEENGVINLTVNGGVSPYTFDWDLTDDVQNPSGLGAGNYSVTVTDSNGCNNTFTTTINAPDDLQLVTIVEDLTCNLTNTAAIDLVVTGGSPPFLYQWNTGATVEDLSGLSSGSYVVDVTDASGCVVTTAVTIAEPSSIIVTGSSLEATCGSSNGSIETITNGGLAPYTYLWSNNATSSNLSNLPAGTYLLTVTDANDCTSTFTTSINESASLQLEAIPTNATCAENADGSIELFIEGGTAPFSCIWFPGGSTEENLSNAEPGLYTVIVTDANGCSSTISQEVISPEPMNIEGVATNAACGTGGGNINLFVTGSTPPYTYLWNNNSSTPDQSNLPSGDYTVTITDLNGCTDEAQFSITSSPDIDGTLIVSEISCADGNDGSLEVLLTGGTEPFIYEWSSGGSNISTIDNLPEGDYSVLVTDANGCTISFNQELIAPEGINIDGTSTNALCGDDNGTIQLSTTGGTSPYTYVWSNGMTSAALTNLGPGNYSVTVTDNFACSQVYQQTIESTSEILLTINPSPTSCNGLADGSIVLNASGGQTPFLYEWNTGAITQNLSNLPAGEYTVTATDNNGCTSSINTTIEAPDVLNAVVLSPTNISCNGANDGSIDLTVSGGTLPYSFDWNNAPDQASISGLSPGTYTVVVTDFNGCSATTSATLTAPPTLTLSATPTATNCDGLADGAIDLLVDGGSPPFQYLWSNGDTSEDLNSVESGTYTVIVTDAQNCTSSWTETILSAEPIAIDLVAISEYNNANVSCPDATNGSATVLATGGEAPFSYSWNTGVQSPTITDLSAGTYSVIVTDANGCTEETAVSLVAPEALVIAANTQDIRCYGEDNGSLSIEEVTGGSMPYLYSLNGEEFTSNSFFQNLPPGQHEVVVQDAAGCNNSITTMIEEPTALAIDLDVGSQEAELLLGEQTMLYAQVNRDTSTLQKWGWTEGNYWMDPSCSQCAEREVQPMETTLYAYEVEDDSGCKERSEVLIKVIKEQGVYIPNAFSPNNDGVNDYFQIYLGKSVRRVKTFLVYDRWGEVLYKMSDFFVMQPGEGWNGYYQGSPMNPAAFVYWAEVEYVDGRVEILKGDLTLIR